MDLIESELSMEVPNNTVFDVGPIKVKRIDAQCSLTFICNVDDLPEVKDKTMEHYAQVTRKDLEKFRASSDESPSNTKEVAKTQAWWYFEGDSGDPLRYAEQVNAVTASEFFNFSQGIAQGYTGVYSFETTYRGQKYSIHFDSLEGTGYQVNLYTQKRRAIRRLECEVEVPKPKIDYSSKELKLHPLKDIMSDHPHNWTDIEHLSFKTSIYNTVPVDLTSDEAAGIIQKMSETLQGLVVYQIERVQNLVAYHKYMKEKQLLQHKYAGEEVAVEKYLFHGTRLTEPTTLMEAEEGFDMRFSNSGMWGKGVYFAEKASYSDDYAHTLCHPNSHVKQVFYAKVLVGKAYNTNPERSIVVPPINEETKQRYDSVEGETRGTQVHIVYDNGRCYPQYLITYT